MGSGCSYNKDIKNTNSTIIFTKKYISRTKEVMLLLYSVVTRCYQLFSVLSTTPLALEVNIFFSFPFLICLPEDTFPWLFGEREDGTERNTMREAPTVCLPFEPGPGTLCGTGERPCNLPVTGGHSNQPSHARQGWRSRSFKCLLM